MSTPLCGDSNEYTQHTIISIKRQSPEIIPNTITAAAMGLFLLGTEEGFWNSHCKRAISVQGTKVLLFIKTSATPHKGNFLVQMLKRYIISGIKLEED